MTDEQIHAISHAQKVLRAVKLYDQAALLSASKPAAPMVGFTVDCSQRIDDVLPADRRWTIANAIGIVAEYRNCETGETKEVMQRFADYMRAALVDAAAPAQLNDDTRAAVDFYAANPNAALLDFQKRFAPAVVLDDEPVRHVGDSNFEGWYQDYAARITGNPKQTARDAYAAGLNEAAQDVSTGVCFFCGESMDGQHEADCPQSSQPSQTAVVLDDERAQFEAWARTDDGGWSEDDLERKFGNVYEYLNSDVERDWSVWQARQAYEKAAR